MSDDLADLRAVAEAATPGPWRALGWQVGSEADAFAVADALRDAPSGQDGADAAHIATFDPPTVLGLLDRLAAAEAAVERVRSLADDIGKCARAGCGECYGMEGDLRAALEGGPA